MGATEQELDVKRGAINAAITQFLMEHSNFEVAVGLQEDYRLQLAEMWFVCPICKRENLPVEVMYLMQVPTDTNPCVIQSVSTFFDLVAPQQISGLDHVFNVETVSQIIFLCRACVIARGIDISDIEVISPDFPEERQL